MTHAFDPRLLDACEQERLDRIGAIQPFGVLLGGDAGDERVRVASADAGRWLGLPGDAVQDRALGTLVPVRLADFPVEAGHKCILPGLVESPPGLARCGALQHRGGLAPGAGALGRGRSGPTPRQPAVGTPAPGAPVGVRPGALRTGPGGRGTPHHGVSPDPGVSLSAGRLRGGHGRVQRGSRTPLSGPALPASDIPKIARDLYRINSHRQIPDIGNLRCLSSSLRGREADLTLSDLRAVSPVHFEYLRNMEVVGSLSFSILVCGALWGLVACHHRPPDFSRCGYARAA